MNQYDDTPFHVSEITQDIILLLARELEWVEAFTEDHPDCEMGEFYRSLLERELVRMQADL